MPSASFQFPVFRSFSFQKSYIGNILGIARDENPGPYFPVTYTETEGETEGSHRAPTPPGGAGPPDAPTHGVGPTGVPQGHPFAYLSLFVRKP